MFWEKYPLLSFRKVVISPLKLHSFYTIKRIFSHCENLGIFLHIPFSAKYNIIEYTMHYNNILNFFNLCQVFVQNNHSIILLLSLLLQKEEQQQLRRGQHKVSFFSCYTIA